VTSKKRWKCETSKELVLENRITISEVASMLTISFGSVQSILKDNLNFTYFMHEWFNLNTSHCCQIFAPPAERSRRIILTHAKTLSKAWKRQAYSTTYKSSNSLGWTTQSLLAQKRQDKFTETSTACSLFFQHSDSCELWIRPTRTNYDMIYLLTAIGLSPSGRSTVHIYTQRYKTNNT
jgi:hypothetical protein